MIHTNIKESMQKQSIKVNLRKKHDEAVHCQLWFLDIEKLSMLTCMSRRWLEDVIICDPRFKAIEIRKNRKRLWPYDEALEVIKEITSEW